MVIRCVYFCVTDERTVHPDFAIEMEILNNNNSSSIAPVACGMKLIKKTQNSKKLADFTLSSLIYIQLPSTFPNGQSRATYTPLDSILFHIQLKFSRYSVQMLITNAQLTTNTKSGMQTSHAFSLPPHLLLKAFSETCYCVLISSTANRKCRIQYLICYPASQCNH